MLSGICSLCGDGSTTAKLSTLLTVLAGRGTIRKTSSCANGFLQKNHAAFRLAGPMPAIYPFFVWFFKHLFFSFDNIASISTGSKCRVRMNPFPVNDILFQFLVCFQAVNFYISSYGNGTTRIDEERDDPAKWINGKK
jgi:hypothetical protein